MRLGLLKCRAACITFFVLSIAAQICEARQSGTPALHATPVLDHEVTVPSDRPNILWISSEDNGPHLGCYGDEYATSPHIDALCARSIRYDVCWSNAPVCAPARTTIITGTYATAIGAQHMRSMVPLPSTFRLLPQYLRAAGYYCTNNSKEDFNCSKSGSVWNQNGRKAHWKSRAKGQPFFSVFNINTTHESAIRRRPHQAVHDPATVPVPAYHPDTPVVRQDWAQYYDCIQQMDAIVGTRLNELRDAGLENDTIVFYFGDHGSGMPRSKRWPYNSGLHVPLIVHVPEKFKSLSPADDFKTRSSKRLVGFVDFAPTLLALAQVERPNHFQGHHFLGKDVDPQTPEYVYGFRGRMDERYDMVRSIRDEQFVYIRNFLPHRIYGKHVDYMFQTPTTRTWHTMYQARKLNAVQSRFWQPKPVHELYDLRADPDEIHNLANDEKYSATLERMRSALRVHLLHIRDTGFLPEPEIHHRSSGRTPYEMAHDDSKYPLAEIMAAAEFASKARVADVNKLRDLLTNGDAAIRFWAAQGILGLGQSAMPVALRDIRSRLNDDSTAVQIVAAEVIGIHGNTDDAAVAAKHLLKIVEQIDQDAFAALMALNALDEMGKRAAMIQPQLMEISFDDKTIPKRLRPNFPKIVKKILADF